MTTATYTITVNRQELNRLIEGMNHVTWQARQDLADPEGRNLVGSRSTEDYVTLVGMILANAEAVTEKLFNVYPAEGVDEVEA